MKRLEQDESNPLDGRRMGDVYAQMIGGTVPLHSGDPLESVRLVSSDLLETDRVHLAFGVDRENQKIHFMAVPSRVVQETAGTAGFSSPLAVALPGIPGHRGDGCYLVDPHATAAEAQEIGHFAALAVLQSGALRLYVNDRVALVMLASDLGLPMFDVTQERPVTFEPFRDRVRRFADTIAKKVSVVSTGVIAVCAAGVVGLSMVAGWYADSAQHVSEQQRRSLKEAIASATLVSPLSEQIARLSVLSSVIVKTGGWIEAYQLKGTKEAFSVFLPEWVSRDAIRQIGDDVQTELANKPGLIKVTRDAQALVLSNKLDERAVASPGTEANGPQGDQKPSAPVPKGTPDGAPKAPVPPARAEERS